MSDIYKINHSIDGHPICKNGEPMSKKQIVSELNKLYETIESLTPSTKEHGPYVKAMGIFVT